MIESALQIPVTAIRHPNPVFNNRRLTHRLRRQSPLYPTNAMNFGTLISSAKSATCPISELGFVQRRKRMFWLATNCNLDKDRILSLHQIRFRRPVGNGLAQVYNCNSRFRDSASSLTTTTRAISSRSFEASTFGAPYSIGTAHLASCRTLLRRAPSQFHPQSSSTPKRLSNLASGSMSVEASTLALLNNNFHGEDTKVESSRCGRFGDITNRQAHYDSGSLMARYSAPKT